MKRRDFILMGLLLLTSPFNNTSTTHWDIIKSTLNHLFPKSSLFDGAEELSAFLFLKTASKNNKYFNQNDLDILILGAFELHKIKPSFTTEIPDIKEKILRKFEEKPSGKNWLSTLMNYGIEGMLCDPIYGGNKNQKGWLVLNHRHGIPRPKNQYAI